MSISIYSSLLYTSRGRPSLLAECDLLVVSSLSSSSSSSFNLSLSSSLPQWSHCTNKKSSINQHEYIQTSLYALTNDILINICKDYLSDNDTIYLSQTCMMIFILLKDKYYHKSVHNIQFCIEWISKEINTSTVT